MRGRVLNMPLVALPDVTLVAISDVAMAATARALACSQRNIAFGAKLWLASHPLPFNVGAEWRRISPIASRADYSKVVLGELYRHVATSHALLVQWDGYVVDAKCWDPRFLEYDYIGARWPHFTDGMNVGNGGFSLRSRRLLEAAATLPRTDEPEDVAICRTHRRKLEQDFGLRFAPAHVARHFAFERTPATGDEFGFHGAFNMVGRLPAREMAALLATLEPHLLNRREHRDIMRRALRRGDLHLAWIVWQRMRHAAARHR